MKFIINRVFLILVIFLVLCGCKEKREGLRIAVASNFAPTLDKLARAFSKKSGIKITIIPGSTGKLFAQIKNGAPYDIFLAADEERPEQLLREKLAFEKLTYAIGQLVLWSPNLQKLSLDILESDIEHIAIANPKLAPYGRATRESLINLKLWDKIKHKVVIAENVSQAAQFSKSENAEIAFIALSQTLSVKGSKVIIPENFYTPILQNGCILTNEDKSKKFISFLASDIAKNIILNDGYKVPNAR